MDPARARELLRDWALEEGFDRAGVATLEPSRHGEFFLRWLEAGHHAGMGYLGRRVEKRLDPSRPLAGARSVLCVALRYWPRQDPRAGQDLWPRVARYAHGRDYHDLMGRGLAALAQRVQTAWPEVDCRWYVDTGPVLERELAARAGVGVVGKNTCLLHREMGSWFLLGELFLTLELAPDQPLADLCGSCTLCLEACPTGALPRPYLLLSERCISYWTIEHRGPVPEAARKLTGDWVFGCDVCQEVCPWNRRRLVPVRRPALELPAERAELDLAGLLDLSRREYVERFRGSPLKRAKLEGLQRNAAVAMGNRRNAAYAAALSRALRENQSPTVRGHASWALGRIGGTAAREALREALETEADQAVREELQRALAVGRPGSPEP